MHAVERKLPSPMDRFTWFERFRLWFSSNVVMGPALIEKIKRQQQIERDKLGL